MWDVATGRKLATIPSRHWLWHDVSYSFAVTPDGKRLAVGGIRWVDGRRVGDIRVFDLVSVNRPGD